MLVKYVSEFITVCMMSLMDPSAVLTLVILSTEPDPLH